MAEKVWKASLASILLFEYTTFMMHVNVMSSRIFTILRFFVESLMSCNSICKACNLVMCVLIQPCSFCRKALEWMNKSLPTDSKLLSQDAWIILKATCIDDWTVMSGCIDLALLCYSTYSYAIPRRHCFTYMYSTRSHINV